MIECPLCVVVGTKVGWKDGVVLGIMIGCLNDGGLEGNEIVGLEGRD